MTEYLFSYGTLQEDDVQFELFGRRLNGDRDVLKGYKTASIELTEEGFAGYAEHAAYLIASVSDDENDAIEGTALEVSGEEFSIVDGYEPEEYKRAKVTLESGKRAWVYLSADLLPTNTQAFAKNEGIPPRQPKRLPPLLKQEGSE